MPDPSIERVLRNPYRGAGIGLHLILAVYEAARSAGGSRVYWQTQGTNRAGRALYDKVAGRHGFIVYSHDLHLADDNVDEAGEPGTMTSRRCP